MLYTSQNLLGTIFRVTFTVFYRRIWNIVGKYSILCCDNIQPQKVSKIQKIIAFIVAYPRMQKPISVNSPLAVKIAFSQKYLLKVSVLRVVISVVYCDVTERNRVAMSRHRHNIASRHYDGSRRCCYSGVN
jgi:hypothetical protein